MFKSKKGSIPIMGLLLLIIVGGMVMYLSNADVSNPFTASIQDGEQLTDQGDCAIEDTTLNLRSYDLENKGTASGCTSAVWVDGQYVGTTADAGSLTVAPFNKIDVLVCSNDSELATGFYPKMVTKTIGCTGVETLSTYVKDKNASDISMQFLNSDLGDLNAISNNETIGSGEETTGTLRMSTTSEDYFGDETMILVVEGTQTVYDELIIAGASKVAIPGAHSLTSGNKAFAYEVPALDGSKKVNFDLTIKAKDGQDPAGNNLIVTAYDNSYFIDADTNKPSFGAEDESQNNVGVSNPTLTVYVN